MHWTYEKLKRDLTQSKYNLKKYGLFTGEIKNKINNLLEHLNDVEKEVKENLNDLYEDIRHGRIG